MLPAIHVNTAVLTLFAGEPYATVQVADPGVEADKIGMSCPNCARAMELFEQYESLCGCKKRVILRCARCHYATEF